MQIKRYLFDSMNRRGFIKSFVGVLSVGFGGCIGEDERPIEPLENSPRHDPLSEPILVFLDILRNGTSRYEPVYPNEIKDAVNENKYTLYFSDNEEMLAQAMQFYEERIDANREELIKEHTLEVPSWKLLETRLDRDEVSYWNSYIDGEIPGEEVLMIVDRIYSHADSMYQVYQEVNQAWRDEQMRFDELLLKTQRYKDQPKDEVLDVFKEDMLGELDAIEEEDDKIYEFYRIEEAVNEITLTDRIQSLI